MIRRAVIVLAAILLANCATPPPVETYTPAPPPLLDSLPPPTACAGTIEVVANPNRNPALPPVLMQCAPAFPDELLTRDILGACEVQFDLDPEGRAIAPIATCKAWGVGAGPYADDWRALAEARFAQFAQFAVANSAYAPLDTVAPDAPRTGIVQPMRFEIRE